MPAESTFIIMSISTASLNSRRQMRSSMLCREAFNADTSAGGK